MDTDNVFVAVYRLDWFDNRRDRSTIDCTSLHESTISIIKIVIKSPLKRINHLYFLSPIEDVENFPDGWARDHPGD